MRRVPATRTKRILISTLLVFVLLVAGSGSIWAHPLGNFTINRYSRLTVNEDGVNLRYILDMAEIPTFQELSRTGLDGQTLDGEAKSRLLENLSPRLTEKLELKINGENVTLQLLDARLETFAGQGGLTTLRVEMDLASEVVWDDTVDLYYIDRNYESSLGWKEVVVESTSDLIVQSSTAPSQDLSDELRNYPEDLLSSPPDRSEVQARIASASITIAGESAGDRVAASVSEGFEPSGSFALGGESDPFADLITLPVDGVWALILVLLAAFAWGGAHALSPGHGKTIVAAYLVGSRGTTRHALFLGLTTTVTHTAGVFALGLLTLFASEYLLPEQLFPWLSVLSGLLVLVIGASMAWGRLRPKSPLAHTHHHDHVHHDHDHDHVHGDHDHHHHHGPGGHSHTPPGTDGEPVTWRSLLALGISGGILPCPSALVVMLGAVALGRIAFGLVLILIFSLGLASVLTLIGILMVHAGKLVKHVPESGRLLRLAPIASALFIAFAGAAITLQALFTTGIFPN